MKLGNDKLHLQLEIGEVQFSYVYIRKNACSSWKKLFVNESLYREKAKEFNNPINFMSKYHKVKNTNELELLENRIVILRDPIERLYSGFINQFISRLNKNRYGVMHEEVGSFLEKPVEEVTFDEFIKQYILKSGEEVNVHFVHQVSHLANVEYNKKWMLNDLYNESESFFGKSIADKYFKKKLNSTQKIEKIKGDYKFVPAGKIYELYSERGAVPSLDSLIDNDIFDILREYYEKDYNFIANK
ncbi:sulfotransferase family 2 domain-containing protein [Halomonas campaniensis]|uniref:Sulfotransferase family protein n=1 Tax=Halomonas campaniensis TaxID=213554 RepID=A0A246RYL1_9GAMM|nr:sulfotransferase family 2 domain-containing protein [Halomonas campaniensis]OWV29263.1 hypothetical protein JI62_16885 [Halomonas campaniensis]